MSIAQVKLHARLNSFLSSPFLYLHLDLLSVVLWLPFRSSLSSLFWGPLYVDDWIWYLRGEGTSSAVDRSRDFHADSLLLLNHFVWGCGPYIFRFTSVWRLWVWKETLCLFELTSLVALRHCSWHQVERWLGSLASTHNCVTLLRLE